MNRVQHLSCYPGLEAWLTNKWVVFMRPRAVGRQEPAAHAHPQSAGAKRLWNTAPSPFNPRRRCDAFPHQPQKHSQTGSPVDNTHSWTPRPLHTRQGEHTLTTAYHPQLWAHPLLLSRHTTPASAPQHCSHTSPFCITHRFPVACGPTQRKQKAAAHPLYKAHTRPWHGDNAPGPVNHVRASYNISNNARRALLL